MLFCPDCGSILVPKEDGRKTLLTCTCGYSSVEREDILMKESIRTQKKVEVLGDEVRQTLPKVSVQCPKCGKSEAYFWAQQTRASDEAETQFFECINARCRHRWRTYG